jgi:hypothetical protein
LMIMAALIASVGLTLHLVDRRDVLGEQLDRVQRLTRIANKVQEPDQVIRTGCQRPGLTTPVGGLGHPLPPRDTAVSYDR